MRINYLLEPYYTEASILHFEVAEFQINKLSRRVEITVVVGRAMVEASNDAHQVIALAVQLSVILHKCISQSTGVPVRLVVIEVIAVARPVIFVTS